MPIEELILEFKSSQDLDFSGPENFYDWLKGKVNPELYFCPRGVTRFDQIKHIKILNYRNFGMNYKVVGDFIDLPKAFETITYEKLFLGISSIFISREKAELYVDNINCFWAKFLANGGIYNELPNHRCGD